MKPATNIILTVVLWACAFSHITIAQDTFYFSDEGKVALRQQANQYFLLFDDQLPTNQQHEILQKQPLAAIFKYRLLPHPKAALLTLPYNISELQQHEIKSAISAEPHVLSIQTVYTTHDQTTQIPLQEVIIGLRDAAQRDQLAWVADQYSGVKFRANVWNPLVYHLQLSAGQDPVTVANAIHESGTFAYAEPDFLRLMQPHVVNDPDFGQQWHLDNFGQYNGTPGADMNVVEAWNYQTESTATIKVAVLDEGVDLDHPDLQANLLPGLDATNQENGGDASHSDGHGTACAGLIAAVANNQIGGTGVAHRSKVIPVRIAYNSNNEWVTATSWIMNAITWAWQEANADVLSNSWGGGGASFSINQAIQQAATLGRNGLGCPVIFSAGNQNGAVVWPATLRTTIAVGASSMCDERKSPTSCDGESWWGSNFGDHLDVVAPGVRMLTTDNAGAAGYSAGDYLSGFNGTSSAAPNVAGVMALLLGVKPDLTLTQARYALESSCDKIGGYEYTLGVNGQPSGSWSAETGYGRVNAMRAIEAIAPLRYNDVGVMRIHAPEGSVCDRQVFPRVEVRNNGANPIHSLTLRYQLDQGSTFTHGWSGTLAPTTSILIDLPMLPVNHGPHQLRVMTALPNGEADNYVANDEARSQFTVGANEMQLTINLDNYGAETTWAVFDNAGNRIHHGGPYTNNSLGTQVVENFCLPVGCYQFSIYDAYGDGICCGYGGGSYVLENLSSETEIAQGAEFGAADDTDYCLEIVETIPPLTLTGIEVQHPLCAASTDGQIALSVHGGVSPYTFEWMDGTQMSQRQHLPSGTYTVTISDATGNELIHEIELTPPPALTLNFTAQATVTGTTEGYAAVAVSGGIAPYRYQWSNAAQTPGISGLLPGIYQVTVTDNNGCQIVGQTEVIGTPVEQANDYSTVNMEHGLLRNVSANWVQVDFENNYNQPVVVTTVRMRNVQTQSAVVTRVRNVTSHGFELKLQTTHPELSASVHDVDYVVVEAGTYTEAEHGINLEAKTVLAEETAGQANWVREARTFDNVYQRPVVLGQVMSHNDTKWSVFWASSHYSRTQPPQTFGFSAGKQVGEDPYSNRVPETIGYLVVEAGNYQVGGYSFQVGLSADLVMGVDNTTSGNRIAYEGIEDAQTAIVSAAALDGTSGGWPVLVGDHPTLDGQLRVAIDEDETVDSERLHTSEQVAWMVFTEFSNEETMETALKYEAGRIDQVSGEWITVVLEDTYVNPIVVATPVVDANSAPVVTRVRHAGGNQFQVSVQAPGQAMDVIAAVQYVVVEEGIYTQEAHGVRMEALRFQSEKTSSSNDWEYERRYYQNEYEQPVVLGQVMSDQNEEWSSFWSCNGYRKNVPSSNGLTIGKHVGEDENIHRQPETLGYLVIEAGSHWIEGEVLTAGVTDDVVTGIVNQTNHWKYAIGDCSQIKGGVLSSAAMDGGDGSFPVFTQTNPFTTDGMAIAVDEDQINDNERAHTTEQVAYLLLGQIETVAPLDLNALTELNSPETSTETSATQVRLYPNPTIELITVEQSTKNPTTGQITVRNAAGITVLRQTATDTKTQLRVGHLPAGHYVLTLSTSSGTTSHSFQKLTD